MATLLIWIGAGALWVWWLWSVSKASLDFSNAAYVALLVVVPISGTLISITWTIARLLP